MKIYSLKVSSLIVQYFTHLSLHILSCFLIYNKIIQTISFYLHVNDMFLNNSNYLPKKKKVFLSLKYISNFILIIYNMLKIQFNLQ